MIAVEDDDDIAGVDSGSISLGGGTKWGRDKGIFAKDASESELKLPNETKATANPLASNGGDAGLLDDPGADLGEFLEGDDLLKDLTKDDEDALNTGATPDEDGGDLF